MTQAIDKPGWMLYKYKSISRNEAASIPMEESMILQFQMVEQEPGTLVRLNGPEDGNRIHTVELVNSALVLINRYILKCGMDGFEMYLFLIHGGGQLMPEIELDYFLRRFQEHGLVDDQREPLPIAKAVAMALGRYGCGVMIFNLNFCSPVVPATEPELAQPVG